MMIRLGLFYCQKLILFLSFLWVVPFTVQPAAAQTFSLDEMAVSLPLPENLPGTVEFLLFGWGNSPEHRDRRNLRRAVNALHEGRALKEAQDYAGAISAYTKAIDFAHEVQEFDTSVNQLLKVAYLDLGTVYLNVGNYQQAVHQFHAAQYLFDDSFASGWHSLYTLLGFAYWQLGDTTYAEQHLWKVVHTTELHIMLPRLNLFNPSRATIDQQSVNATAAAYQAADLLQAIYIEQGNLAAALEVADRLRARVLLDSLGEPFPDNRLTLIEISAYRQVADELALTAPEIQQLAETLTATLVIYSKVSQDTLYIWVVRPQQPLAFQSVQLPHNGSVLLDTAQGFRAQAARGIGVISLESTSPTSTVTPINPNLVTAYDQLIAPIESWLPQDEAAPVIFVPHQELFALPFAAFVSPSGQQVVDRWTMSLAPSLQSLAITEQTAGLLENREPKTLVLSNPSPMPENLTALPGTLSEGRAIAALQPNTSLLEETDATEANFNRLVNDATIVHLATHGILDDNNNLNSWLAFASSAEMDGKLTVEEVFQLDLTAELVILSACETGLGRITGEGVLGMTRAFMSIGTPSVVSSLWLVPDDATALLMTVFHRELGQGTPKAQALRTAMLETRAQYPDPVYWAGFTLMGNPY